MRLDTSVDDSTVVKVLMHLGVGFCNGRRTVLCMTKSYSLRLGFYRASWCSGTSIQRTCTTVRQGVAVWWPLRRIHHQKSPVTIRQPLTGPVQRLANRSAQRCTSSMVFQLIVPFAGFNFAKLIRSSVVQ